MIINPDIFKAYDVRAIYPTDLNEESTYAIVQAYIKLFKPKKVVLGKDVRESGPSLFASALKAFLDAGVDVIDIGTVSTDTYYFAAGSIDCDGGITISASHNPREYNGLNFCLRGAEPVSSENGLLEIRDLVLKDSTPIMAEKRGTVTQQDITEEFLKRAISFIDPSKLKPMKIVANANFGVDVILLKKAIEMFNLPLTIFPINDKPDGTFPKGPPNPLLLENRIETLELIKKTGADLAVSWDADGDRCFFADETATFIEGYFITAVISQELLQKYPNSKIIIDPRLIWATTEAITKYGGTPVMCKPGMTIIAAKMKEQNAIFGGEMSSHFYFRDNYYRDNGIIPLFLILEMISEKNLSLSQIVNPFISKYFISGELNFKTEKKDEIITNIKNKYNDGVQTFVDGLSVEYSDWRFNLRKSNTEPLLRLNLEAMSKQRMEDKRDEIVNLIKSFGE